MANIKTSLNNILAGSTNRMNYANPSLDNTAVSSTLTALGISTRSDKLVTVASGADTEWVQVGSLPRNLRGIGIAYSAEYGKTVAISGYNNSGLPNVMMEYENGAWTEITDFPMTMVSRADMGMVYNDSTQKIVMFGGSSGGGDRNDTWEWDSVNGWVEISPYGDIPAARNRFQIASQGDFVIMHGGDTVETKTWTYGEGLYGKEWVGVESAGPINSAGGLAYDPVRDKIYYCGYYSAEEQYCGTWEYDAGVWTEVNVDYIEGILPAPSRRYMMQMVFDYSTDRIVLFGGQHTPCCGEEWYSTKDAWEWNGTEWSLLLNGPESMNTRNRLGLVYDLRYGHVLLAGGDIDNGQMMADSWILKRSIPDIMGKKPTLFAAGPIMPSIARQVHDTNLADYMTDFEVTELKFTDQEGGSYTNAGDGYTVADAAAIWLKNSHFTEGTLIKQHTIEGGIRDFGLILMMTSGGIPSFYCAGINDTMTKAALYVLQERDYYFDGVDGAAFLVQSEYADHTTFTPSHANTTVALLSSLSVVP